MTISPLACVCLSSCADMDERVQWALTKAALWNETKDKLHQSGYSLRGQQQRLCIARAGIAIRPEARWMSRVQL